MITARRFFSALILLAAIFAAGPSMALVREVLTAPRTYFVRTDGNDLNAGLLNAPGEAFRTISRALAVIALLDQAGQTVGITIAAPAYPVVWQESVTVNQTLTGQIAIAGATGNRLDVTLSPPAGNALNVYFRNIVLLSAVSIKPPPGWHGIVAIHGGRVFGSNLSFDGPAAPAGSSHVYATRDGYVELGGVVTVLGPSGFWLNSSHKGEIRLSAANVAFAAGVTFDTIAYTLGKSEIVVTDGSTISGSAIGRRYYADGGWIQWMTGNESSFPGTVAGAVIRGGVYKTAE